MSEVIPELGGAKLVSNNNNRFYAVIVMLVLLFSYIVFNDFWNGELRSKVSILEEKVVVYNQDENGNKLYNPLTGEVESFGVKEIVLNHDAILVNHEQRLQGNLVDVNFLFQRQEAIIQKINELEMRE